MLQETDEFQWIAIFDIIPDPNNPRQETSGPEDVELEQSVKEVGVLQPIMVRFAKKQGKYMIVFGHRRLQAAIANQFVEINCIVKELTDAQALEYQIIENLQRKDINAMEESNAFQRLIKKGLSTAEMISDKLGVSTKYVYDRLALQRVIPEVQEAVKTGKISITHGKQFARLPLLDQGKLLKNINISERLQVHEIRSAITNMFKLNLDEAVFNIDDAALVTKVGSCLKCRKRSGCNQLLFEEVQMEDVCFDSVCYDGKVQAHIDSAIEIHKAAGKTVRLISSKYTGEKEGLINARDWDQTQDSSSTVGIFLEVNGYGYNQVGQVINLKDAVENEDEESAGVKSLLPVQPISFKKLFADKSMDAILEAYQNEDLDFPSAIKEDVITEFLITLFNQLSYNVSKKIAGSFGISATSSNEIDEEFKKHAESLSIYPQLELIGLITQLDRVDNFDSMPDQAEIESEEAILHQYGIDFFKIAADLNAPYPLFTPTEVAEAAEA